MRSIKWCHSNDLERTLTLFSRSHNSLALNISQTATDTAIVTIDLNKETHTHEIIIIILSLTNVTDRQKSPVFCCKKSGNPKCSPKITGVNPGFLEQTVYISCSLVWLYGAAGYFKVTCKIMQFETK